MNISSKVVKNALGWSFAAEIAAKIIVPIINMILARLLAPEAFGIVATISMIVSFADMLSYSGISKFIVQHDFSSKTELYKNADVVFWTNMLFSILGWILIIIFSTPISTIIGNPGFEIPLIVSALSIPLNAFSSIQEAIYQRDFHYKKLFYLRIAVSFLPFFITIPLALMGFGYWSLIIGTLSSNVLKIIVLSIAAPWKPSCYFNFSYLKKMFSFCFWMLLSTIATWLIKYIDIIFISNAMGEYYTGLYKTSQNTVTGIISIITAATSSVLFASLSREQKDKKAFENIFFSFQQKVGVIVIPLGIGIYCFSDLVTSILLGRQWLEASKFIGVWGLSTALVCVLSDFCQEALKSKGKPQITFFVQLLHLMFIIPICYINADKSFLTFGYIRSAANLEIILLYFLFTFLFLKISPLKMLRTLMPPFLSALCMGVLSKLILNFLPNKIFMQFIYIFICIVFYFSLISISKKYRTIIKEFINLVKDKLIRK